ncbi:acriflavin resistance protein [Gemmatirosa kalamazoonensis]|uniref:Acriflavin resistance protein n=1 Tax=Gemmatirosa kalamazoonensis TaxID=861299 RepID=W0RFC9_9BACT|nr:efflux RND transporter permease subunit [Gemmatirosa kalamazoonensis]AHG89501.1 acriflavin resistance protein [Gemmatirosa kalamazoonensis]
MTTTSSSGLFGLLAAQRRFVYLVVALLSAAGVWAAFTLPSAIYPELNFSRITVVVQGSALGARQVLFSVTRPIEEAVSIVPGVTRVQSKSIRGGAEINVTFAERADMQYALQQVQARVNQVQSELPAGLDIQVERQTPSLFPILSYNLEGGDPATLYDIAQYQIRPIFARVPGVGRVDVQASDVREIEVVADPARLAAQGMTYDDLAAAIRQATTVNAVGRMPTGYKQYLVVTTTEAQSAEDVASIVVGRGLRVRDVARVLPGTEDHVRVIAGDGRPAALLNVTRQIGGNTLAISDSVAALAAELKAALPPGVRLKPVYDQAALVRDAVRSVRDAMLVGAVLAVLVLLVFLRHARITAISASAIPLTMAITVFVMARVGQTFNLMTLGAMAIAIGLVIDDAVVVTENIVRHLHLTPDRAIAVRHAVQELIWPVTTSTITTVVVFLPLGLLTGVEGQFFRALSITLTIAVLVSLVLALTVIPLMAEQFLTTSDERGAWSMDGSEEPSTLPAPRYTLASRYESALAGALHHTRTMLAAAVVLVAAGAAVYHFVGTGFLPEMDEGAFILDYVTPGGTALAETDRQLHVVERILATTPEVAGTSRRTGAELGLFATEQNTGDIAVRLRSPSQRDRSVFEVIDEVRTRVQAAVPRMRVEFVQILSDVINDLAGAASPVEIKLFGSDLAALEAYGHALGEKLEKVEGLEDVYNGVSEPSAEMQMTIDAAEANRVGLTPDQVSAQVAGALLGAEGGDVRLSDRAIGIRVRAPDSVRFDPAQLGAIPIVSPESRATTPLGALASFHPTETRAELLRENQQQMIDVTADISGRALGPIMDDVKAVVAATPPPRGVRVELAGQYASQQAAFRALLLVLAIAALSVIAVMVVQFESFVEPLVVLLAAPLSFVGAMLVLLVTHTPLNVSSFMGLILLVGLIVKNGIILLDFTRHRMRTGGLALEPAIREAARIRLRPILMTTLCTLFGLLPLALGLGAGSELQRPLALAVIGGLALSTPITLFVVPTLLVAIRGREYTLQG